MLVSPFFKWVNWAWEMLINHTPSSWQINLNIQVWLNAGKMLLILLTSPGLSHVPAAQIWGTVPEAVSESPLSHPLCWHSLTSSRCVYCHLKQPYQRCSACAGSPRPFQKCCMITLSRGTGPVRSVAVAPVKLSSTVLVPKQSIKHLEPFNVWCTLHRSQTISHSWVVLFDSSSWN